MFRVVSIFFLCFISSYASIDIDEDTKYIEILSHSTIYIDKTKSLNLEEVKQKEFKENDKETLAYGFAPDFAVWVKFTLQNTSDKPIEKILLYEHEITTDIVFYDGERKEIKGFYHISGRNSFLTPSFEISLASKEIKTYYIKAYSIKNFFAVKLNLWDKETLYIKQNNRQFILALFLGALGLLVIYNLFIFLSTKDRSYLLYVLYISLVMVILFFYRGLYYKYNISILEDFAKNYSITFPISIMVLALFIRSFLNTKQYPKIDKILYLYIISLALLIVVNFISDFTILGFTKNYTFLLILFLFSIITYSVYKKNRQAYLIFAGWLTMFVSVSLLYISIQGIFSVTDYFPYVIESGIFIEAVLFSFALADRIKVFQRDKEKANAELLIQKKYEEQRLKKEVREKTKELTLALDEKELLLRELHHRVKNNMQMVISILRLQSRNIKDKQLKNIFEEAQNRINAMSQLHEIFYSQEEFSHINSLEYFSFLIQEIQNSYKKEVQINYDLQCMLQMEDALYCGLILNELITNAYKYAFNEEIKDPIIDISLENKDGKYILKVEDNGVGYKDEKTGTLGLSLIKGLATQQLKGSIDIDGNNGVKAEIVWRGK